MLACKVADCQTMIKYDMAACTTSGMINHLKNVHKIYVR